MWYFQIAVVTVWVCPILPALSSCLSPLPLLPLLPLPYVPASLSLLSVQGGQICHQLPTTCKRWLISILLQSKNVHVCGVINIGGIERERAEERGREGVVGRERERGSGKERGRGGLCYLISSWSFISIRSWVTPHALVPLQYEIKMTWWYIAVHKVIYHYCTVLLPSCMCWRLTKLFMQK